MDKLLKLDPKNTVLLEQKQKLLADAISQTKEKLQALEGAQKQVENAFNNGDLGEEKYMSFQREVEETRANLKKYAKQLSEVESENTTAEASMKKLADSVDDLTESTEKGAKAMQAGTLMQAADALADAGEKIKDFARETTDSYMEMQDATSKVSAYFAETGDAAKESAEVIKNAYTDGVGDSMDSVADAVIMVKKNIKGLNQESLEDITKQAITLEDLFDVDMNETLRGVDALMVNFGMSAQEAMDYVVKGTQNGLDKTNELGDNLSEYSGKFAQAGYSASEYFQLLNNGLDNGAYNLDKVNDAINEVTTRLADGTVEEALKSYSKGTRQLFKDWQKGKATQKDVIDSIVDDINNCENQQEALNLAATAFGTMAEDGSLKFIRAMKSNGNAYDDVKGSAQDMFDATSTASQAMRGNMRELQMAFEPLGENLAELANAILPPLVNLVKKVSEKFKSLPGPVQDLTLALGAAVAIFTTIAPIVAVIVAAIGKLHAVLLPVIAVVGGITAGIALVVVAIKNWSTITEKAKELFEKACEGIHVAWENVQAFFDGLPEWWNGVWDSIQNKFDEIWKSIVENPTIQATVQTILSIWNSFYTTISSILSGIENIFKGTFELIKNTVLGIILLLIDLILGDFESFKSDLTGILENILAAAKQIWQGISQTLTTISTTVVLVVKSLFNSMLSALKSIWNNLTSYVTSKAESIKNSAVSAFKNMASGVANAVKEIPRKVAQTMEEVASYLTSLPGRAYSWGSDFMAGFARGIASGVNAIIDKVKGLADKIRSYLHFSRPDVGPLRDYETWMPDFVEGLANGINANIPKLSRAAENAASAMNMSPSKGFDYDRMAGAFGDVASRVNNTVVISERSFKRALIDMGVVVQ